MVRLQTFVKNCLVVIAGIIVFLLVIGAAVCIDATGIFDPWSKQTIIAKLDDGKIETIEIASIKEGLNFLEVTEKDTSKTYVIWYSDIVRLNYKYDTRF